MNVKGIWCSFSQNHPTQQHNFVIANKLEIEKRRHRQESKMIRQVTRKLHSCRGILRRTALQQRRMYGETSAVNRRFQFQEGFHPPPQQHQLHYQETGEWMFAIPILGLGLTTAGSVTLMEAHSAGAFQHNNSQTCPTTTCRRADMAESCVSAENKSSKPYHRLFTARIVGGDNRSMLSSTTTTPTTTTSLSSTSKTISTLSYHGHSKSSSYRFSI